MAFCSRRRPRRSRPLPAIPSTLAPRSLHGSSATWGQLTHHPHVHCIVPGGRPSPDGKRWIACRPGHFLPERVLSTLFRGAFLEKLVAAHKDGRLQFFSDLANLAEPRAFCACLAPLWRIDWVVDCKQPFAGPELVLRYL